MPKKTKYAVRSRLLPSGRLAMLLFTEILKLKIEKNIKKHRPCNIDLKLTT